PSVLCPYATLVRSAGQEGDAEVGERELLAFRTGARRVHLTRCQQLRVLETLERAVQTSFGDVPARRGPQRLGNGGDADRLMVGDERQDDGREHRLLIGLDPRVHAVVEPFLL